VESDLPVWLHPAATYISTVDRFICGRVQTLTVNVDVHDGSAFCPFNCEGADALAIVRVPEVDPASAAGGEQQVTVLAVPHTCERSVVSLEQDRPHCDALFSHECF